MSIYTYAHIFIHIYNQVNNKIFCSFSLKDQLILSHKCGTNFLLLEETRRPGDRKTSFKEKDLKYHLKI